MTSTGPVDTLAASITTIPSFGKEPLMKVSGWVIVGRDECNKTWVTTGENWIVTDIPGPEALASLMAQRNVSTAKLSKTGMEQYPMSLGLVTVMMLNPNMALASGTLTAQRGVPVLPLQMSEPVLRGS